MKMRSFGLVAIVCVFLIFSLVASGQMATSEGPSVISVFTGAVRVDKAGYFEVNDVARIDIDKYVAESGEDLMVDVTNKLPYAGVTEFTFAVQIDDLDLVSFASGSEGLVREDVFNYTTTKIDYGNGTIEFVTERVNDSSTLVSGTVWSEVGYHVFEWDGRIWAGTEVVLGPGEVFPFKFVLKTKNFGESVKYSYLMNASSVYVDFDPYLNPVGVGYEFTKVAENNVTHSFNGTPLTTGTACFDANWSINSGCSFVAASTVGYGNVGVVLEFTNNDVTISADYFKDKVGTKAWMVTYDAYYPGSRTRISMAINNNSMAGSNPGLGFPKIYRSTNPYTTASFVQNVTIESVISTDNVTDGLSGWHTIQTEYYNSTLWFTYLDGNIIMDYQRAQGLGGCCFVNYTPTGVFSSAGGWGASSTMRFGNITVYAAFPIASEASELEGDNAIETAINSLVPSATKYKTRQVYVVNATNSQQKGTVDYLVVQNSPQRRWLLNYITAGEGYLNAQNLSSVVYVLEITNKTIAQITDEVSTFINSTKN